MASFSNVAWSKPGGELDAGAYCRVCLIDANPSGKPKTKALCKLPVRKRPGGPVYKAALRNAAGRIFQMSGVPSGKKKAAARRLVSLMRQAKIEVSSKALLQLAGRRG